MAKQLAYEITTDPSKGIAGLKQFNSAVKKSMKDVGDSTDDASTNAQKLAKVLAGMADDLEDEMKKAAKAADALGKALGPEMSGRTDLDSVVNDLKKMGLSFDEITDDADALAASLKRLDDVQLSNAGRGMDDIADSSKRAKDGVDDIGKSAGSSKSVLANMIGNTTQDLGVLGGVAGSAGVAIGQMGEYMADAAADGDKLGTIVANFATVAGPIAALSVGVGLLTHVWENYQKTQEAARKATEEGSKALAEQLGLTDKLKDVDLSKATTAAEQFNTALIADEGDRQKTIRSLGVLGERSDALGQTMIDLERNSKSTMERLAVQAGIPLEWAGAIAEAVDKTEKFSDARAQLVAKFDQRGADIANKYRAELEALEQLNDEQQKVDTTTTAQNALDLARGTDDATAALVRQAEAQAKANDPNADAVDILNEFVPLQQQAAINLEGAAKATERFASSQERLAGEIDGANDALDDQVKALEDQITAAQNAADTGLALLNAEENVRTARAETAEAVKEHGKASKEYGEAIEKERDAVLNAGKTQQAYREQQLAAQGAILSATDKVDGLNKSLEEQASHATKEAQQAVYNYLIQLNQIPDDKVTEITAAVDAGDLETANQLLDEASKTRKTAIELDVDTTEALRKIAALGAFIRNQFANVPDLPVLDAGGTAGGFGGIAGERGPEILNNRYLATHPVYIPPGTRVTSRKRTEQILRVRGTRGLKRYDAGGTVPAVLAPTININSAVVGNPFDVMNAVNDAVRRAARLLPRHP